MKKTDTYSTQYKIIQSHKNDPNPQNFARSFANKNSNKNPQSFANKKILTKDRQEFINNISASGFKQFHKILF